jgi:hypothetical protein
VELEVDEVLLKVVAAALTRGQGAFTEEELFAAYQQVATDKLAGTFVELLLEGHLALVVNDEEEVKYIGLALADKIKAGGDKLSDEELAAAVEAFISATRPPKES